MNNFSLSKEYISYKRYYFFLAFIALIIAIPEAAKGQQLCERIYSVPGASQFIVPFNVNKIIIETWGGGGRGGSRGNTDGYSAGGGGGAYSLIEYNVTPGQVFSVNVGAGSNSSDAGGDTWVSTSNFANAIVLAKGGKSVAPNGETGANGGAASEGVGSTKFSGGKGGNANPTATTSGGGGSSAGNSSDGNPGIGRIGGLAPGTEGGDGSNGFQREGNGNRVGAEGSSKGGGGSGAIRLSGNGTINGGKGGDGFVRIRYSCPGSDLPSCATLVNDGSLTGRAIIEYTSGECIWTPPQA